MSVGEGGCVRACSGGGGVVHACVRGCVGVGEVCVGWLVSCT